MSDPKQPGGWGEGAKAGEDFAATSLDRPALDFGTNAAPPAAGAPPPAAVPWAGGPPAAPPWTGGPPAAPPSAAPWAGGPAAPPAAAPWAGAPPAAPSAAPAWAGGPPAAPAYEPPKASFAATSVLPASGHAPAGGAEDFAATTLDRPAIAVDVKQPPSGGWGSAPAAAPSAAQPSRPAGTAAQARPAGAPVPQSDLGLKLALGGLVALIVVITIVILVGVVTTMGDDEEAVDATEQTE